MCSLHCTSWKCAFTLVWVDVWNEAVFCFGICQQFLCEGRNHSNIQTVNLWMICRPGQSSTQSNHSSGNAESGIQIWRRRQTSHYRLLKMSGVRAGFAKTAGPPGLRALWPYEQSSRSLHTSTHDVTHVGVGNVVSGGYWLVNISQYCSSWEVC